MLTVDVDVLDLGESFDARDLAKKAEEAALIFDGGEKVDPPEQSVLRALNSGLRNFLTGEYAVEEPEGAVGYAAVQEWVEFAADIAYAYKRLSDDGYTMFYLPEEIGDVLEAQAEELGLFENMPSYIQNAINWRKIEDYILSIGTVDEMWISGQTYLTGVRLPS